MWRKIRKFLVWTISICISLVLLLALTLYLMRDKIKGYAVEYINTYLHTPLLVSDIDVTFISTFPNATVCLVKPYMLDPDSLNPSRDTLFSADKVFFEFDIWDIFEGKYDIKKIRGQHVYTRLYVNSKGKENYDILKPSEERGETPEEFQLNLQSIETDNLRLLYRNDFLEQEYAVRALQSVLSGTFKGDQLTFTLRSGMNFDKIRKEKILLLQNQEGNLSVKINVDKSNHEIHFPEGNINLGKMQLGITGLTRNNSDSTYVDLEIKGTRIPLVSVLTLMPEKVRRKADQYESRGMVDAVLKIAGHTGKTRAPQIDADFHVADGSVAEKKSGISLHNIDMQGTYTNHNKQDKDELYLRRFDARMKDGSFSMRYRMKDFTTPQIDLTLESNLQLETLHKFLQPAYIENMRGTLTTSWGFSGTIENPDNISTRNVQIHKASGRISFNDASLRLSDMDQQFTALTGTFLINKSDAVIDNVSGRAGTSDFVINGAIQNLTTYMLTGTSTLNIVGDLTSDRTDLNDLIPKEESAPTAKNKNSYRFHFPTRFNMNVDLLVGNLGWNKFKATDVACNVRMMHDRLDIRNLTAAMSGGKCKGDISMVEIPGDKFKISSAGHFTDVNMDEMMYSFGEFDQKIVTSANLGGKMTADLEMAGETDGTLVLDRKKLLATAHVSVKKGRLKGVSALKSITRYMKTDRKARLVLGKHADEFEKRLENIQFSDMENVIEIKDEQIHIPRMKVTSTALEMNVSGLHGFNNQVDYRFSFRFRDLKNEKKETEFGTIRDDGTGFHVYLRMHGDINDPVYELDKEQMQQEFHAKMEDEKKTVKSLLKEEFGIFKNDTTLHTKKTPADDVEFILEWEDTPQQQHQPAITTEEKKKRGKEKLSKLKKKLGIEENKEKPEFIIDENP